MIPFNKPNAISARQRDTDRKREREIQTWGGGAAAAAHRLEPDLDQNLQSPSGHRTRDQLQPNEASSAPELALPCLVTMDTTTSGAHCLSKRGGGGAGQNVLLWLDPPSPHQGGFETFTKPSVSQHWMQMFPKGITHNSGRRKKGTQRGPHGSSSSVLKM